MPIRTASLNPQIQKNGARLHLAIVTRTGSKGADHPASEAEQALLEERRALKGAKAALQAQPARAKPQATWMTKEAKAPAAPKAAKAPKTAKEPKDAKAAAKGNKPTRAEKMTKKAESLDAAKKATKKSAKT